MQGFGLKTLKERNGLEDSLREEDGKLWTVLIWLMIGTSGEFLENRRTFRFHETWGIP
jgi:hypothetical protein